MYSAVLFTPPRSWKQTEHVTDRCSGLLDFRLACAECSEAIIEHSLCLVAPQDLLYLAIAILVY